jgi:hypothetical protein
VKPKQHRLNAAAQSRVEALAKRTGWSESGAASFLIVNAELVINDKLETMRIRKEIAAAEELHKVRSQNDRAEQMALKNLNDAKKTAKKKPSEK